MGKILFILITVPLVETWFLIQVGKEIGALPTILCVIATAVLGGYLVKQQGLSTLNKVQTAQQQGELPAQAMLEGVMILLAGALLLTPGFFTDGIGFLLLWPTSRQWLLKRILAAGVIQFTTPVNAQYREPRSHNHQAADDGVIEGEYRRERDE